MAKSKQRVGAEYILPQPSPDKSDLPELPDEWTWTTVRQIAQSIQYGYTATSSQDIDGPHYLRITDIQSGKVDWSSVPRCEIAKEDVPKYLLKLGDIVFARSGATAGKSFLIKDCPESVFASYLIRVQTLPQVLPDYLYAFFNSKDYWDNLVTRGNAQPNANAQVLGNVSFPLPPLPEQQRIVARIESLFAESRTARDALERVPALLKRFRQSVLASAFRGELTERDPNDEPASALLERGRAERPRVGAQYIVPLQPAASDLPEGWAWVRVGEIAEVRLGRQRSPSRATGPNMRSYLRAANVTWNGLDLSDVKEMDFSPAEQKIYRLKRGDVLLAEASGSVSEVGKPIVWNEELEECYFQNTLIRVRSGKTLPRYLYLHFLYDALTARFSEIAQGIGINHLGANGLSGWVISLPPLAEQRRIVAKIEALFAQADAIERAVAIAQKRAGKVDQAILVRAFRGELT